MDLHALRLALLPDPPLGPALIPLVVCLIAVTVFVGTVVIYRWGLDRMQS